MSDDSNAQGTPPPGPSWTPPPGGTTPPPPPEYQGYQGGGGPAPDPSGGVPQPAKTGASVQASPALIFGAVAVVAIVLSLFIKESPADGVPSANLWDTLSELWSIVAILAAVVTLLPALRTVVNLGEQQAWKIAAAGAAALVLWWVLFILPVINLNVSFLATVGVAAAVIAVWSSPGNPYKATAGSSSSS